MSMRKTWIAAACFFCVLAALEVWRWRIWSFGSDTGTFTQAILAAAQGFRDGPEGGSHFFFHFSPILAALYPLVALTHSPLSLQIAQVALIALTAPAVYALFRPYVREEVAFRLALVTLVYPPLAAVAFGEFHELAFFPLLAVCLLWSADRCRWGWFAAASVASLLTREDVCLELTAIGLGVAMFALLRRKTAQRGLLLGEPREPLATAAAFALLAIVGACVAGAYYGDVVAAYGRWPHGHFYVYPFAQGPLAVLGSLIAHPLVALPALAQTGRLTYVLEALAPLAFLPLRSRWVFAALPGFAVVLLAAEQSVWRMGNHYAALWAPWVLIATGAALVHIGERRSAAAAVTWTNYVLAACAVVLLAFNPMHAAHYLTPPYRDLTSAREALACVPHDASVSTHDEWFSEISADFPNATIQSADGPRYLVYADDFPNDRFAQETLPRLRADVASGRYRIICAFGRVTTYMRTR